jgi:transketolase
MFSKKDSVKRCKLIRQRILEISKNVSALHVGGSFSSVEIIESIYFNFLKKKDKFILSKGHAGILQYVVLEIKKKLKKIHLDNYSKDDGMLGVHPDYGVPGIMASTGSLGHGLGITCGMALKNKKNRYFVLLSDGELHEGSTWESILLIPSLKIKNITMIIDNNNLQSSTWTNITHPTLYPLKEKLISFGWDTFECNGHSNNELYNAFNIKTIRPKAIIAKTIKGYPVSFMKNNPLWHYRSPNEKEYEIAMKEIKTL